MSRSGWFPRRIAITGATGFLGSWTCKHFLKKGYEVVALGRNTKVLRELEALGAQPFKRGLEDADPLIEPLLGVDAVVHCAALSSPWGKQADFYLTNVAGTRNILTAAHIAQVKRLVHISTPSLYVSAENKENVAELDPLPETPINHYVWSKRVAENYVDEAQREGRIATVTLRPQAIIGPGDPSIFPRILRMAQSGWMPVIGSGTNFLDLTCVENVVDAIDLAIQAAPQVSGHKFNITNGEPVSLYATFDHVLGALGIVPRKIRIPFRAAFSFAAILENLLKNDFFKTEPLVTRYSVCVLGLTRTLNIEAAKKKLGYLPRVSLTEALPRLLNHLQSNSRDNSKK